MRAVAMLLLLASGCGGGGGGDIPALTCIPDNASCEDSLPCCNSASTCVNFECKPPTPATGTVVWSVMDTCQRDTIHYAFFDDDVGARWPVDPSEVYLALPNNSYSQDLFCHTGDQICIGGADVHYSTLEYGVGLNDGPTCLGAPCCFACSTTTVEFTFACP